MQVLIGNKKSNEDCIERIILENYNQYYRLAYSYVHNEADAFDIVQNGACKALQNAHSLREKRYAETWVYRIMLNECFRNFKRATSISYEAMLEQAGNNIGSTEDHYSNIDLQKALEQLENEDKAIVIMKYFEEKKLDEIAEILEQNVSTVKSKLYRSMKKLQQILSCENEKK